MNTRNLAIVVGILALVAGGLFLSERHGAAGPEPDPRVGTSLTGTDIWEGVRAIHLLEKGELKVRLQLDSDGRWYLPDEQGLPVNFQGLARLVNQLVDCRVSRFVTRREERLDRLETRSSSLVLFGDEAATEPLLSLHFGKSSDTGGVYVQFGDEPEAYLTADYIHLSMSADSWIDKSLLPLKPEDIRALTILQGDGTDGIRMERPDPAAPFSLAGDTTPDKEVNQETVKGWLNDLASMRFTKHTEAGNSDAVEARNYARSYVLDTFDGHTWTLDLGRRPEQAVDPVAASADESGDPAEPEPAEPETIPAGTAYAFIDPPGGMPVNIPYSGLAFEIASYSFSRQPEPGDWLVAKDPPKEPAPGQEP